MLGGSCIIWRSKVGPETRPCMSSSESELYAAVLLALDLVWTRQFLSELGIFDGQTPSPVFIDNIGAEMIMQDPGEHKRFRHLRRRWYFIRCLCGDGTILPIHVNTEYQTGDIFTKPLQGDARRRHVRDTHNVREEILGTAGVILGSRATQEEWELSKIFDDEENEMRIISSSFPVSKAENLCGLIEDIDEMTGMGQEDEGSGIEKLMREVVSFYENEEERDGWIFSPVYLGMMEGIGMSNEHILETEFGTN